MNDSILKNYRLGDIKEFVSKEFHFESYLFTQEDQIEESTLVVQTHSRTLGKEQILSLNLISLEELVDGGEMFLLQFYAEFPFNENKLSNLRDKPFLDWLNGKNSELITGNINLNNDGKLIYKYYLPFSKFEVINKEIFSAAFILVMFSMDMINSWILEY